MVSWRHIRIYKLKSTKYIRNEHSNNRSKYGYYYITRRLYNEACIVWVPIEIESNLLKIALQL